MNAESTTGPESTEVRPATTVPAETTTAAVTELANKVTELATNVELLSKKIAAETGEITKGERRLIKIGIISVVVNLVIAFIYLGQLTEMITATRASTNAANAATASVGVARETLGASKNAMLLDQRAWVGLSQLKVTSSHTGLIAPEGLAVNSGKTPARDVHAVMGIYAHDGPYIPNDQDYDFIRYIVRKAWNKEITQTDYLYQGPMPVNPPYDGMLPPLSVGVSKMRAWVLVPELKSMGVIPPGNSPYKPPFPNSPIGLGISTLIFYGEIRYTDFVGKERRSTQFCYYEPPESSAITPNRP
jgi:hypothetical protein